MCRSAVLKCGHADVAGRRSGDAVSVLAHPRPSHAKSPTPPTNRGACRDLVRGPKKIPVCVASVVSNHLSVSKQHSCSTVHVRPAGSSLRPREVLGSPPARRPRGPRGDGFWFVASAATLTALLLRSLPDAKGKPYTPTLWPGMTTDDSCTQKRAAAWMTRPESLKGRVRGGTVQALLLAVSRNGKAPYVTRGSWRDPDQHGNGSARQDDQGGRRRESDRNHPQRQDRLRRVGTASSRSTR